MTCPTPQILDLVRGQLAEARRYTRSNRDEVDRLFAMAILNLGLARRQIDGDRLVDRATISGVGRNLYVGWRCMPAAPDVTDAYITGALWELGDIASRLRKEDGAEERDAELMAAYGPREDGV